MAIACHRTSLDFVRMEERVMMDDDADDGELSEIEEGRRRRISC